MGGGCPGGGQGPVPMGTGYVAPGQPSQCSLGHWAVGISPEKPQCWAEQAGHGIVCKTRRDLVLSHQLGAEKLGDPFIAH